MAGILDTWTAAVVIFGCFLVTLEDNDEINGVVDTTVNLK